MRYTLIHKICVFFLLMELSLFVYAQIPFCRTSTNFPNQLELNDVDLQFMSESESYTIRVFFHIIRQSDGIGGQNETVLSKCMEILNADFSPYNIAFVNSGYDYIDNSLFYNSPGYNYPTIFSTNRHNGAINIYLLPASSQFGGLAEGIPGTALIVGGYENYIDYIDYATSHILSHEMGHCLGLFHTFHGTSSNERDGSCSELVDGSNCFSCGDFVCDTPADPAPLFNLVSNCAWNNTEYRDPNGMLYRPDTRQIMAYTYAGCMEHFSDGQGIRIRNYLSSSEMLKSVLVPNDVYIQNKKYTDEDSVVSVGNIIAGRQVTEGDVGDVIIQPNANVTFCAGKNITLKSGFSVQKGGSFSARIQANAQSYLQQSLPKQNHKILPFLDNTQWQCAQRGFGPTYYIRFYNYVKDTIIANKSYAKIENTLLVRNMLEGKRIVQTDEPLFVRENDGYVWRLYNKETETLLYNFNLTEADDENLTLTTINVCGVERKQYIFKKNNGDVVWIEGIGNTAGVFSNDCCATNNQYSQLLCVKDGTDITYDGGIFYGTIECSEQPDAIEDVRNGVSVEVVPTITNHSITILTEQPIEIVRLYDHCGKMVMTIHNHEIDLSLLPAGMYIVTVVLQQGEYTTKVVKL